MKFKKYKPLLLLGTVMLIACAGIKAPKGTSAEFKTRISDSGLKHFELRYIQNTPIKSKQPLSPKRLKKAMLRHAEKIISENNYCREDFWLLNFDIDLKGPFIRGECNDLANSADRSNFSENNLNW